MITTIRKNLNSPAVHSLMITAVLTMILVPFLTRALDDNAINKDVFKKQFAYISYEPDKMMVKRVGFPMEDLQIFYDNENSRDNRYMVPEKRRGIYWEFSPEAYGVVVTDFARAFNDDVRLSNVTTDEQALQAFVAKHNGVQRELPLQELSRHPIVRELFVLSDLDSRAVKIYKDKDNAVIVQLDEIKHAYTPKLEEITSQVYQDWMKHNAKQRMQVEVKKAYKQALQGNWEKEPTVTDYLILSEIEDIKAIREQGLNPFLLDQMNVVGAVIKQETEDKVFIIRLEDVEKNIVEKSDESE